MILVLLIKEKNMSIARINMLEFDTEDDLEQRANVYKNEAPKLFPNAEILLTIRTGPLPRQCQFQYTQTIERLKRHLLKETNILNQQKYSRGKLGI